MSDIFVAISEDREILGWGIDEAILVEGVKNMLSTLDKDFEIKDIHNWEHWEIYKNDEYRGFFTIEVASKL